MDVAALATGDAASRRVILGYYALAGLYTLSAAAIWGVNTLFLLDAGLSFLEVFVANAAFSAGMVVFEIPTGVVADTLGRRVSFLLSVSVLAASTLLYVALAEVGAGVVAFSAASVAMGLGFTFYSGATEAWLVDALRATGFAGLLDRVFARAQQVTGAAMLAGTVGGGLLGQLDLSAPYLARSALLLALLGIAVAVMRDLGFEPRRVRPRELPAEVARTARAGLASGWSRRPIRLVMLAGAVQTAFFAWGFYAAQPYLLDLLGSERVWVAGLVAAGIALATIAGNQMVDVAARACRRRTTLLLAAAALQTAAAVAVGLAGSFWAALSALLLLSVGAGMTRPVQQAYIHHLVPSQQRATVLSLDSLLANGGAIGGQVGLGALGEARSVAAAFVAGGAATAAALPLLARVRALGGAADRFDGEPAGAEPSCPAGLPPVAGVEEATVEGLKQRAA